MEQRRRRAGAAAGFALGLAALAVAATAVLLGLAGVFEHGHGAVPCPVAQAAPSGRPCAEPAG